MQRNFHAYRFSGAGKSKKFYENFSEMDFFLQFSNFSVNIFDLPHYFNHSRLLIENCFMFSIKQTAKLSPCTHNFNFQRHTMKERCMLCIEGFLGAGKVVFNYRFSLKASFQFVSFMCLQKKKKIFRLRLPPLDGISMETFNIHDNKC